MSNPYTSVAVSGYNASPPSDDGAKTVGNQLDWDKHLEQIGAPLKTAIEAVNANALAAFGLVLGQQVLSKSANYTVATADRGAFINVTAAATITLLAAATAGTGFPILITNTSTVLVRVAAASSETINGANTQFLFPGDTMIITCDGSNWVGAIIGDRAFTQIKASATDRNTTVTLADDPDLTGLLIPANQWVELRGQLHVQADSATPDFKSAIIYSQTPQTQRIAMQYASELATPTHQESQFDDWSLTFTIDMALNEDIMIDVHGFIHGHATNDGTAKLQWAQANSDAADISILTGSWMQTKMLN